MEEFAIRHKVRLVIMAQQPAISVHCRNAVARSNKLAIFNHEAVYASHKNVAIAHQCRQPRACPRGAFAGLPLIISIGISRLQIIRDRSFWPKQEAWALPGQRATVHGQLGKVIASEPERIFLCLRDIG